MSATATSPKLATFARMDGKDVIHRVPDGTKKTDDRGTTVVSLCATRLSPNVVAEDDSRAERVGGDRVCGTCARLARDGKTQFPKSARGETPPAEPAKPASKPKKSGEKKPSAAATIEPLSKTELKKLVATLDELAPKWKKYSDDRAAKKPVEKRRERKAYAEYEAAYARIRRSGQTVREARAAVAS
jgi:hypothetical protein